MKTFEEWGYFENKLKMAWINQPTNLSTNCIEHNHSWEANNHTYNQEISCLYGNRRYNDVFTRTSQWSLPWARCIQFTSSYAVSLRYILILFSHLHLVLSCSLFPSGSPTKILHSLLICPACYMPRSSRPPWLGYRNTTWRGVQVTKFLIMQSSSASPPASHHFLPLRSKYFPQHPVLKHPQCTFLP
jgi:hypothetical protein